MREVTSLLLEEIAHCPVVVACSREHPCSRVVDVQRDVALERHQVPEPWSGRLDEALILFISTSPAIARGEDYAVWSDPADATAGFFENRFGDGPRQIREGIYPPIPGRHSTTPLRSWIELKARAAELVDDPVAGVDYAVTYAVHCPTQGELGVRPAMTVCPERYLRRVIAAADRAHVLVAVGPHAGAALHEALGVGVYNDVRHVGPLRVEGRDRHVVYLDHFGGYGAVKQIADAVEADTLEAIRATLAERRVHLPADGPRGDRLAGGVAAPAEDPAAAVRAAFRELTASFDVGEARWLATSGRLAEVALSRAGWRLHQSVGERDADVLLFTNPTGLVVSGSRRALLCCDYAVVTAADMGRPHGLDRIIGWARERISRRDSGAVALAAIAVPAPVDRNGSVDGRALEDVAQPMTERLAALGPVDRFRVQDGRRGEPVPCLDIYLVGPR